MKMYGCSDSNARHTKQLSYGLTDQDMLSFDAVRIPSGKKKEDEQEERNSDHDSTDHPQHHL